MTELTPKERYALFLDALTHCGRFLLDCDEKTAEYHLFEEFDGDCTSFLSEENLTVLEGAGLISPTVREKALTLAHALRSLEHTSLWTVQAVRTASEWRNIMTFSDELRTAVGETTV